MVSDGRSTRACDAQVAVAFGVEPVGSITRSGLAWAVLRAEIIAG